MSKLITRTLSGLIIVILTIITIALGEKTLAFFIFLLSIIGIKEFYNAVAKKNVKPVKIIGYLSCVGFFLNSLGFGRIDVLSIFILAIIGLIIVLFSKKENTILDIAITFFSIIYIPFLFQHIIYLDNKIFITLIFIMSWGTDTFAYLVGNLIGKHKLSPNLSPKKTIEGSIGGILGSTLLTILLAMYFELDPIWKFAMMAIFGSVIAQLGDLFASKIKRLVGIKDFGFIMPGHGGILDRFDSILLVAPYTYYVINYFL